MDDYHIDMKVSFDPDKQSLQKIDKIFDQYKKMNLFGSDEQLERMRQQFSDYAEREANIRGAKDLLTNYQAVSGADESDSFVQELKAYMEAQADGNEELKKLFEGFSDDVEEEDRSRDVFVGNLKTQVVNKLASLAISFLSGIAGVFKDAWEELGNMVNSSFLSNSTTRENAFSYGFTAAESYGFEQAKSMLGINSEEDLWYMNDYQQQKFREIMTKYAERYQKLYDSGFFEKYLDFQIEMQEFKLDMEMEIIEFFMSNKNTIVDFMHILMDGMEFIVDALGWLVDFFDSGERTSDEDKLSNLDNILSQYTTHNNVNVTTTNNNSFNGTTDSQSRKYLDMLNSQIIEAKRAFGG